MVVLLDQARFAKRLGQKIERKPELSHAIMDFYKQKFNLDNPTLADMILAICNMYPTQFKWYDFKNPNNPAPHNLELEDFLTEYFQKNNVPNDEKIYLMLSLLQDAITYPLRIPDDIIKKEIGEQDANK
jgi:hypothetical protein